MNLIKVFGWFSVFVSIIVASLIFLILLGYILSIAGSGLEYLIGVIFFFVIVCLFFNILTSVKYLLGAKS